MGGLLGSIVIPAYNEGAVIERCLDQVFDGIDPAQVEVVVACNGCVDDTAERARRSGHPVTVIELEQPGKVGALNAADDIATTLPRLYLDADVSLPGRTVRRVLEAAGGDAVAARPAVVYETAGCSWAVRRYYRARQQLPSVMSDLCAAGAYCLSATARGRFDRFPDLTADDLFAARIVEPDEIVIVEGDPVQVHAPRTSRALLTTLKRVYRGNRELATVLPDISRSTTSGTARELRHLARRRGHRVDAAVYAAFALAARVALAVDRDPARWERDETTRVGAPG